MTSFRVLLFAFPLVTTSCIVPVFVERPAGQAPGMRELVVQGDYIHASGAVFPEVLAGCRRGSVTAYSSEDDVGATYDSADPSARVLATIYVYPRQLRPPLDLQDHFAGVVSEIERYHPGAEIGDTEPVTIEAKRGCGNGLMARFEYETRIDFANQSVTSLAYLFVCGDWFVKYRVTFPQRHESSVMPRVQDFLEQCAWPEPDMPQQPTSRAQLGRESSSSRARLAAGR